MEPFKIKVTDVKKPEYVQSRRQVNKRIYLYVAIAMVALCAVIVITARQFTASAILIPVIIFLLIVLAAEVRTQRSYQDNIQELGELYYEFGPEQWAIHSGDAHREFKWSATPKLVKTKDCLFVYHEARRSNLVPRRLLTPEQEEQILKWYGDAHPTS